MEKGKKNTHFGQISRGCTSTEQSCTGTDCSILTSVRILPITCSFLIRFE